MDRDRNTKSRHFPPAAKVAGEAKIEAWKGWEDWEDQVIRDLRAEGKTFKEISQRLTGHSTKACKVRGLNILKSQSQDGSKTGEDSETSASSRGPRSYQHWRLEEVQLLKRLRESGKSWAEVAAQLPNRTSKQCITRWQHMLHRVQRPRKQSISVWKEWEEQLLVSGYYGGLTWAETAKSIPDRTKPGAQGHWRMFFCSPNQDKPWIPEELAVLTRLRAEGTSWDEISHSIPGHTSNACRTQWYREKEGIQGFSHNRPCDVWSAEEADNLVALYNTIGPRWEEIYKYFPGRTQYACQGWFSKHCTKESGVGDAPSEYWTEYFMNEPTPGDADSDPATPIGDTFSSPSKTQNQNQSVDARKRKPIDIPMI